MDTLILQALAVVGLAWLIIVALFWSVILKGDKE